MSDGFEFVAPGQVAFGPGKVRRVPEFGAAWGQRVLVVTGSSSDRAAALIADLQQRGFICCIWRGAGEPEVSHAEAAARAARDHAAEWVLSVGGGAALDLGKAAAALAPCRGPVMDYLEVVGKGRPLGAAPLPMIAVPVIASLMDPRSAIAVMIFPVLGSNLIQATKGGRGLATPRRIAANRNAPSRQDGSSPGAPHVAARAARSGSGRVASAAR